jgi:hypothetical protein
VYQNRGRHTSVSYFSNRKCYNSAHMKKLRLAILILLMLIIGTTLISAGTTESLPGCQGSNGIHHTYRWTLDGNYAPCTYLQRFTSSLEILLIFPIFFTWPLVLVYIIALAYRIVRKQKLSKEFLKIPLVYLVSILFVSLLVAIGFIWS